MGYAQTKIAISTYVPDAAVLIANDAVKTTTSDTYVIAKTIILGSDIGSGSLFRFTYDIQRLVGGTANAVIARNGVYQSGGNSTAGGWVTFTEDLPTTNWVPGDIVSLYCHGTLGNQMQCRNFRICGLGSEWYNTVV
jgi:hypothetical protein